MRRRMGVRHVSRLQRWAWKSAFLAACTVTGVGVCSAQATATEKNKAKPQAPMTQEQAKELFRSVDEILGFVSSDTKLPIDHSVKRKLISRDEVTKYLKVKFDEDESAKRMERSELVLKKFGLLDRDFHLRPFLLLVADGTDCRFLRQ